MVVTKRPAARVHARKNVGKKPARTIVKKPAVAQVVSKKPAASGLGPAATCKPLSLMTKEDFRFFRIKKSGGVEQALRGCKGAHEGHMFAHLDFNRFAERETKVPANAKEIQIPSDSWISRYFWDPSKRRLLPDPGALPPTARGVAYRIEDSGGMSFVCYVHDDAVAVFRRPSDGYVWSEDWPSKFDEQRLFYVEQVARFEKPVKTWIGEDTSRCKQHGNSILVELARTAKWNCLSATVFPDGFQLSVSCTTMAGAEVLTADLNQMVALTSLSKLVKSKLGWQTVRFFDKAGVEVPADKPLGKFAQLTLQDPAKSYVHIGSTIFSFTLDEDVEAYYSRMGSTSVPYPMALTKSNVVSMLDRSKTPRGLVEAQMAKKRKKDWSDSWDVFAEVPAKDQIALQVEEISKRLE